MSGETFRDGLQFLHRASNLPELFVFSDDDEYPPTQDAMKLLYVTASSPSKKLVHYSAAQDAPWLWYEPLDVGRVPAHGGHGTDMFQAHPELPGFIVHWFVTTLLKTPGHAPADGLAAAPILNQLQSPGGAAEVTKQPVEARRNDLQAQLWPEAAVDIIGEDYQRVGDVKNAIEIFKLNLLAYPQSADANSNLADAYLANGEKDLARQYGQKALALLDSRAAPASSWSDTDERRGEIRRSVEKTLAAAGAVDPPAAMAANVFRDCRGCPEMVVIPAGKFTMGSSLEEKQWAASHGSTMSSVADEAPQHQVSLPSFALGKYDVTRAEYAVSVRETGYPAGDGCGVDSYKWDKNKEMSWQNPGFEQSDHDPVVCVSWRDARAYVAWLNKKTGARGKGAYRLPAEAEWEYAARAGTATRFWWGDEVNSAADHAWFKENSGGKTQPAGAKPANGFGLYDMVGNAWQWTEDCYAASYSTAPTDGSANERGVQDPRPEGTRECMRVDRGGSWRYPAWFLRPWTRERNPADFRDAIMGFRVAKTLR